MARRFNLRRDHPLFIPAAFEAAILIPLQQAVLIARQALPAL